MAFSIIAIFFALVQEALDLPKPTFADDFVKAQGLKTSRRHAFEIHQPKLNPVHALKGLE